jgi:hypothetical protein
LVVFGPKIGYDAIAYICLIDPIRMVHVENISSAWIEAGAMRSQQQYYLAEAIHQYDATNYQGKTGQNWKGR